MTFVDYLNSKNITIYGLSKSTRIPYSTICDLVHNKTSIENLSLKNAIKIASSLHISVEKLVSFQNADETPLIYRGNLLHKLKELGDYEFIEHILKSRTIEYYIKNKRIDLALYTLALIEYLDKNNNFALRNKYLRLKKLIYPLIMDNNFLKFNSIEEVEKALQIQGLEEFKKYNILEENIRNVA